MHQMNEKWTWTIPEWSLILTKVSPPWPRWSATHPHNLTRLPTSFSDNSPHSPFRLTHSRAAVSWIDPGTDCRRCSLVVVGGLLTTGSIVEADTGEKDFVTRGLRNMRLMRNSGRDWVERCLDRIAMSGKTRRIMDMVLQWERGKGLSIVQRRREGFIGCNLLSERSQRLKTSQLMPFKLQIMKILQITKLSLKISKSFS